MASITLRAAPSSGEWVKVFPNRHFSRETFLKASLGFSREKSSFFSCLYLSLNISAQGLGSEEESRRGWCQEVFALRTCGFGVGASS